MMANIIAKVCSTTIHVSKLLFEKMDKIEDFNSEK